MIKNCVNSTTVFLCGLIAGCGEKLPSPPPPNLPAIKVVYQSGPVANVHVQLHASDNGPVLARAITSTDGKARFVDLPNPEPSEYFVSLESVSDGSWILDPKLTQRFTKTLRLDPLTQNANQSIELPPRSIQSLHRTTR